MEGKCGYTQTESKCLVKTIKPLTFVTVPLTKVPSMSLTLQIDSPANVSFSFCLLSQNYGLKSHSYIAIFIFFLYCIINKELLHGQEIMPDKEKIQFCFTTCEEADNLATPSVKYKS